MRKLQFALVAGLAVSASASFAADVAQVEPLFELRSSVDDWTGAYVGGQLGYRLGRTRTKGLDPMSASSDPTDKDTAHLDSLVGGIRGGYDLQVSPEVVVGVALDASYGDDTSKKSAGLGGATSGESKLKQTWDASLRLRAGVLLNESTLVYATGGAAMLGEKLSASVARAGDESSFSDTKTHFGWTIGAGVEAAIADNWRVFAEYRYAQFDTKTYRWDDENVRAKSSPRTHAVLTGVNYAF